MRLTRIKLENFGSFQSGEIDLTSISAATVSGLNGHGKSTAFIDGPLWCLTGKCRSSADDMMRLHTDFMSVSVDIELDGQTYFIQRNRSKKTKAGKSELVFVCNGNPIGGQNLRETQEKIDQTFNCDYDLLVSTSFLVQGQADRFTGATPGERKAILAQVLKLNEYKDYKTLASKRAARIDSALDLTQKDLAGLQPLIEIEVEMKQSLDALMRVQESNTRILEKTTEDNKLKQQLLGKLQAKVESLLGIEQEVKQAQARRIACEENMKSIEAQKRKCQESRDKKAASDRAFHEVESLNASLQGKRTAVELLAKELNDKTAEIEQLQEKREKDQATLASVEKQFEALQVSKERILERHQHKIKDLEEQLTRGTETAGILKVVPCWSELQEQCQFTIKATEVQKSLPTINERLEILRALDPVEKELPNFSKDLAFRLEQKTNLSQRISLYDLEPLKKARSEMIDTSLQLGKRIQQIEKSLEAERKNIIPKEVLDAAEEGFYLFEEQLTKRNLEYQEFTKLWEEKKAKMSELIPTQEQILEVKRLLEEDEKVIADIKKDQEVRLQQESEKKAKLLQIEEAKTKQSQLMKDLRELMADQLSIETLKRMYDVIPVLLMEISVPLLEEATNTILEKISPSGMRVSIETQKALKSGGVGETLDILVRDSFGQRPYENYSGGERFRLDLALRLGLSHLLMNRAGSKIETLIIDEGLGTLDLDGLTQLRECLSQLESSYKLILVISHVEEIKGTFPTTIEVEKVINKSDFKVLS